MKISESFPPNYAVIKVGFPECEKFKATFCYGDTIYNPFKVNIPPDIVAHEEVHQKQQENNPDEWWFKYLQDPEFRLQQEIEAYGTQFAFAKRIIKDRRIIEWLKGNLATALSSSLYGSLISLGAAESKIRNYAKRA